MTRFSDASGTALIWWNAIRLTASEVLEQYGRDRFAAPSSVDAGRLRAVEGRAVDAVADHFDLVVLAPVVPFGTHSAFAGVSQNNVITTTRGIEVAADPTNALALEAAVDGGLVSWTQRLLQSRKERLMISGLGLGLDRLAPAGVRRVPPVRAIISVHRYAGRGDLMCRTQMS